MKIYCSFIFVKSFIHILNQNQIQNFQNIFLFHKFYCVNKFPEIELKIGKIDMIKMF